MPAPRIRTTGERPGFGREAVGQFARVSGPIQSDPVRRPRLPGLLLGIGLGGFVDGIVFHQILQWHHMLSSEGDYPTTTIGGLEDNTLADGLFHAATWLAVVAGIWILWRRSSDWRWAINGRALVGWIVVGFGLFNVVEGVVDHQILGIHHVRDDLGGPLSWDLGFLAVSCTLILAGWAATVSAGREG
jgi:uncharacterized membrane protein